MGYLQTGGWLMAPLLAMGGVLWVLLTSRFFELRRGWKGALGALIDATSRRAEPALDGVLPRATAAALDALADPGAKYPRRRMELAIWKSKNELFRYQRAIDVITMTAPMLGLMGTVAGMVETFDALGQLAQVEQTSQVAAGISQALITTEFGLFLSIPGLLAGRALDRRALRLSAQLDELGALIWEARSRHAR